MNKAKRRIFAATAAILALSLPFLSCSMLFKSDGSGSTPNNDTVTVEN